MPNAESNLEIMKKAYGLFFAGEVDKFFEVFDDSIVLIEPPPLPYGGKYIGKTAVVQAIGTVMKSWDKLALQIETLAADGDYVLAYGEFAATGLATGIQVTFPLAEVWKLRNGRVVFLTPIYGDTDAACRALGHSSALDPQSA